MKSYRCASSGVCDVGGTLCGCPDGACCTAPPPEPSNMAKKFFPVRRLRTSRRIVETVGRGDPFVASNAYRLRTIAWALLGLQLLSLVIGGIGEAISSREIPLHLDAGFSFIGWLAVVLTIVLARGFAEEGDRMEISKEDDQERLNLGMVS